MTEQPPEPSVEAQERIDAIDDALFLIDKLKIRAERAEADLTRLREQVEGLREAAQAVVDDGVVVGLSDDCCEVSTALLVELRAALAQAERPEEAGAG